MPKWSEDTNYLEFVDQTIIFAYANRKSLKLMMDILKNFENQSGQMMKRDKSSFYAYHKIALTHTRNVEYCSGFNR